MRTLEKKLSQRGLLAGPVDGFFDERTKAAVQKLERQQGWKTDGLVGERMRRELGMAHSLQSARQQRAQDGRHVFRTVNINVKSNPEMPQDKVVHDVRKAARQGGLIGWQEIGPARYVDAIKNLGPEWGHYFPRDGRLRIPNPISWKRDVWQKQDAGFLQTHGGKAKVSPNRYITWVKLKHRQSGKTIVRLNTHLVSGAWSGKPHAEWRQEQWRTHIAKLKDLVAKFKQQGHLVIVGGDFNRDSYRVLGDRVAYDNKLHVPTHGRSTLDYVMHVKNDELRRVRSRVERGFRSDHDAVVVRYALK